ncbi:MAG: hypothetical protein K1X53_14240 [Candidatus Sumerlaeaceae bacterium]|nr:hypothetical protein [Candidatus Sumerlaeaceae bacterium]
MVTFTIELADDRASKLSETAKALGIAPEELVRLNVEDWLAGPDEEFMRAANRVVTKNMELYKRLA